MSIIFPAAGLPAEIAKDISVSSQMIQLGENTKSVQTGSEWIIVPMYKKSFDLSLKYTLLSAKEQKWYPALSVYQNHMWRSLAIYKALAQSLPND